MRVLQLISSAGYYGAENMLVTLAQELSRAGCPATVGALRVSNEPEILARSKERGLKTQAFPCNGRIDFGLPGRLANYLRDERIDILHTHGYKANLYGWRTNKGGAQQVATCHNWAVRTGSLGFYSVLDRLALRRVPAIAAVSETVAERLAAFGVHAPRVRVIPNGVDVARFSQAEATLRRELNLEGRKIIGTVTRLTPGKGCDILLASLPSLFAQIPDAVAVLVGAGALDAELKGQAATLNIADRVFFTGARADMPAVYASFDVFVLPSLDEGMPISILEAMSAGTPVVATDVGAVPQLITGTTGWLIPAGQTDPLTHALAEALANREEAQLRTTHARALVEAKYSARAMAQNYLRLYETLIPPPPSLVRSAA